MSDYPKPPVREAKKRERSKDRDDSKSSDKKQKRYSEKRWAAVPQPTGAAQLLTFVVMKSVEDEGQPSRKPRWSSYSSDVLVTRTWLGRANDRRC